MNWFYYKCNLINKIKILKKRKYLKFEIPKPGYFAHNSKIVKKPIGIG